MFKEILRIVPVLDEGRTKAAEMSLSRRFGRVAKRFGSGLKRALKTLVIGSAFALITRLLNPLQDMHDRIKKLFEETEDLKESAAKYGTTEGTLAAYQTRAKILGVKPEDFMNLVESFRRAVDQREKEVDEGTRTRAAVDPLLVQKDRLAGFQRAMALIDTLIKTDPIQARAFQRELFGDLLVGNQKRLLGSMQDVAPIMGNPYDAATRAQKAIDKIGQEAELHRAATAVQEFEGRIATGETLNGAVTHGILRAQREQQRKELDELQRYETLSGAADVLNGIAETLKTLMDIGFRLLAWLNEHGTWFREAFGSIKPFLSNLRGRK